ncbi:MAG: hypothetical protein OXB86_00820 [Bdellovibrionales bacterium]|nr:hypothetical protein [Bdellovibrionales bacterium]
MKFLFVNFIFFLCVWILPADASVKDSREKQSVNPILSQKNLFFQKNTEKTYSWFFDSVITKQELALVPTYFRSRTYGSNLGVRFFTFSPNRAGYYGSFSILNQVLKPYFKVKALYRKTYLNDWKIYFTAEYSNYFQPWYGEGQKGMQSVLPPPEKNTKNWEELHSHRILINQKVLFKKHYPLFYEMGISWIFRQENLAKQKKRYFEDENFPFPEAVVGYDSRDSWENAKKGQYHQLSIGCALRKNNFCRMEGDFRFYLPFHNKAGFAFRGFAGMAFFNELTYSLAYSLGGSKVFRGFPDNRFRGDKIYFTQSELRLDLWKEIISGVLFFEIGEVASFKESFMAPRWNYGMGLRFGFPPSYKIKLRTDFGFSDKESYNITVDFRQAF